MFFSRTPALTSSRIAYVILYPKKLRIFAKLRCLYCVCIILDILKEENSHCWVLIAKKNTVICHWWQKVSGPVRTSQSLRTRKGQQLPVYVRKNTGLDKTPDSAMGRHLRQNDECRANYSDNRFSILGFGRSDFHLSMLDALYIMPSSLYWVCRKILCILRFCFHVLTRDFVTLCLLVGWNRV